MHHAKSLYIFFFFFFVNFLVEIIHNLFQYKEEGKLTIELLDTDSDTNEDQGPSHKWNVFVKKFTSEDSIANMLKDKLAENPVFLPRYVSFMLVSFCCVFCYYYIWDEKEFLGLILCK